ncbi:GAF and ANTAR domain-containing protein [Nocardioides sp. zg-DK7169]|uniref:GAF and ANTAR domain-containing protein n=1 Tax=Nocardioides sp. zg-DK7169 TaxID=2736600 RepID=UPI0015554DBC|nr:GAF and ANTAR domain-containing protein [Nocardioides sp. zg-DK7169]NPC98344.1 GAF and ANTAR domain-containing protein [Nocardioides sp. zg-DK7169]
MRDETPSAAYFAELAVDLLHAPGELTFQRVVDRAVEVVPGSDYAGITLRTKRGRATTVASTDEIVELLDKEQYALGQGPCLDAADDQPCRVAADLGTDERWPQWAPYAVDLEVRSVLSLRLHNGTATLGALNLYAARPDAFDQDAVDVALIFTTHATEALRTSALISDLQTALGSRHAIGIAQGVLAARYGLTYEAAFAVLHRYSNETNTVLREVAERVMETRELPSRTPPPG